MPKVVPMSFRAFTKYGSLVSVSLSWSGLLELPFRAACGEFTRNQELTLDQLLAEPLVHLRMACDRVQENVVRQLAAEILERDRRAEVTRAPPARAALRRA